MDDSCNCSRLSNYPRLGPCRAVVCRCLRQACSNVEKESKQRGPFATLVWLAGKRYEEMFGDITKGERTRDFVGWRCHDRRENKRLRWLGISRKERKQKTPLDAMVWMTCEGNEKEYGVVGKGMELRQYR